MPTRCVGMAPGAKEKGPYGHLDDHPTVNSGKPFTQRKKEMLAENQAANSGQLLDNRTNEPLVPSQKHKPGVRPPDNEAQIDHVYRRSYGGPNIFSNADVRANVPNFRKGHTIE